MYLVHLLLVSIFFASAKSETSVCDNGWHHYKHGFCLKYVSELLAYEQANTHCSANESATMLMLKDSDLQLYLTFTARISDNVWLGTRFDSEDGRYIWNDGTPVGYTDWEVGYPKDITDSGDCVELNPAYDALSINTRGKWANVNCSKLNSVICQRTQESSVINAVNEIEVLKKSLIDANKWMQEMKMLVQIVQQDMKMTRSDLVATQTALQRTTDGIEATKLELQATTTKLEAITTEFHATRVELDGLKQARNDDIQNTKSKFKEFSSNLQTANADIRASKTDLESTKRAVQEINQKVQNTNNDLRLHSEATMSGLQKLSEKVVPVGSIYIEYYNQASPRSLWPSFSWQDVSSSYSGLFFRVAGYNSAGWGSIQSACAPRITYMAYKWHESTEYPRNISIPSDGWSNFGSVGRFDYRASRDVD